MAFSVVSTTAETMHDTPHVDIHRYSHQLQTKEDTGEASVSAREINLRTYLQEIQAE